MAGVITHAALAADIGRTLGRFRRQLRRAAGTGYAPGQLSESQAELLRLVSHRPGVSVSVAAAELGLVPNAAPGTTFHADYFEAWDEGVKRMWQENCLNKKLNCSGGDLGNGQQLKGTSQPAYGWTNPKRLVPISSISKG